MACAEKNIWRPIDLQKLLQERTGYALTHKAVSELMTKTPKQIKLSTLNALCNALDCSMDDIIVFTPDNAMLSDNKKASVVGLKSEGSKRISKPPV